MMNNIKKRKIGKSRTPFAWQSKHANRLIRKRVSNKQLPTTLATYLALTEIASDQNKIDACDASYMQIGKRIGRSKTTAKRQVNILLEMGLILKTNKAVEKGYAYFRNTYTLLEPKKTSEQGEGQDDEHTDTQYNEHGNTHNNDLYIEESIIEENSIKKNLNKKKSSNDITDKETQLSKELVDWFQRAGRLDIANAGMTDGLMNKYGYSAVVEARDKHGRDNNAIDNFFNHLRAYDCGCSSWGESDYPSLSQIMFEKNAE